MTDLHENIIKRVFKKIGHGVTEVEETVEKSAGDVGLEAGKTTGKVVHGAETGATEAGDELKKGAAGAGHEIAKGVDAAGRAIEKEVRS